MICRKCLKDRVNFLYEYPKFEELLAKKGKYFILFLLLERIDEEIKEEIKEENINNFDENNKLLGKKRSNKEKEEIDEDNINKEIIKKNNLSNGILHKDKITKLEKNGKINSLRDNLKFIR